jgi:carbamoyltransferase
LASLLNLQPYTCRDELIRHPHRLAILVAGDLLAGAFCSPSALREIVAARLGKHLPGVPVHFHDHHAAHAASAYYASPFEQAVVVTLDGEGDGAMGSVWDANAGRLAERNRYPAQASIALFYKLVTALLGFRVNRDEGKVMALAALGDPARYASKMAAFLHVEQSAREIRIHSTVAEALTRDWRRESFNPLRALKHAAHIPRASNWDDLWNRILASEAERIFAPLALPNRSLRDQSLKADLAAAAQQAATHAALALIRHAILKTPNQNLAVAGGLFANICLNQQVVQSIPIKGYYVHPGMGDEGLAYGAAMLQAHTTTTAQLPRSPMAHSFLGCPAKMPDQPLPPTDAGNWTHATDKDLVEIALAALLEMKVVGLCRGRMEYGPRALGARSILAHPAQPNIHHLLNARLNRSEIMPFAPAVLDSMFNEIFELDTLQAARGPATFMTIALPVRQAWRARLPAVVHADGTGRPQRVEEQTSPFLHALLERFHQETGLGCVLNTSFNTHGQPIVRTLKEAVATAAGGAVDLLITDDAYLTLRRS